ncbi:MAG: tetratricopeptide repeat protein [Desulfobulbaceae bacterium]
MQEKIQHSPGTSGQFRVARPWLVLVAAGLLLYGCGVRQVSLPPPSPASMPTPAQPPAPTPRERVTPPAALALLHDAEQALHAGNTRKADEYLERAIRIDPQNPQVWHALARSKFQQKQYPQTIQMSLKSNSFRPDRATERSNWLLMEQAYLAMGDSPKAKRAGEKARN